jgi:hypothetical protein
VAAPFVERVVGSPLRSSTVGSWCSDLVESVERRAGALLPRLRRSWGCAPPGASRRPTFAGASRPRFARSPGSLRSSVWQRFRTGRSLPFSRARGMLTPCERCEIPQFEIRQERDGAVRFRVSTYGEVRCTGTRTDRRVGELAVGCRTTGTSGTFTRRPSAYEVLPLLPKVL